MLFAVLLVATFLALVVQEFIPPVEWLHGARVLLYPSLLFYGALALPYGWMLGLAFATGLMWDLNIAHLNEGVAEVSPGWSIVLYALLCLLAHGLRPMFLKGHWEIHCLLSAVGTSVIVAAEYLLITIGREGFVLDEVVWWRVAGSGLVSLFLAPVIHMLFHCLAVTTGIGNLEREAESLQLTR